MSKRPKCEAGAVWNNGRIKYACTEPAIFQMVMGEELLIIYCAEHAKEQGVLLVAGGKVTMEHLPWE